MSVTLLSFLFLWRIKIKKRLTVDECVLILYSSQFDTVRQAPLNNTATYNTVIQSHIGVGPSVRLFVCLSI